MGQLRGDAAIKRMGAATRETDHLWLDRHGIPHRVHGRAAPLRPASKRMLSLSCLSRLARKTILRRWCFNIPCLPARLGVLERSVAYMPLSELIPDGHGLASHRIFRIAKMPYWPCVVARPSPSVQLHVRQTALPHI